MSSHGRALGASGATSLHDVDLGTGRVDAQAETGKLPIPEDGVLVIDRETVDDPFGERAILVCGHRLVPAHPFGGRAMSPAGKRRRPGLVGCGRLGALSS